MCLYSTFILNRKYTSTIKNGGNIPTITDNRVKYVPIGCQQCIECRKKKAREWQCRLTEDIKTNTNGKYITLTFSDASIYSLTKNNEKLQELEGYALDNAIAKTAVRLFLERWRKKYKKSLRHFLITELGHEGTENIHLHGIIWTNESYDTIAKIWNYGFIWPNKYTTRQTYVSTRTVNYIIKYITKLDTDHPGYRAKILTSPGIGNNYTKSYNFQRNAYKQNETNETYRTPSGHKISLPIYWRNKIYTEQEREKLWLEKLDKGIIWVCKDKINAEDIEGHIKLLEYHRRRNKELGYGDGNISWDQEQYETQRRNLLNEKRLKRAQDTNGYRGAATPPLAGEAGKRFNRKYKKTIQEITDELGINLNDIELWN